MVVREQREKIQSGRKKDRSFEGGWDGSAALAEGVQGGIHSAGRCGIFRRNRDAAEREAPGVRAAKSSEYRKEE